MRLIYATPGQGQGKSAEDVDEVAVRLSRLAFHR
jgi:hypothetical protein